MMPRRDQPSFLRLRPIWTHLEGPRFPLERADLLDRLKVFADAHRPTRWALHDHVMPVVDVTPSTDQQPSMWARLLVGAGGVGFFGGAELRNPAGSRILIRPIVLKLKTPTAFTVVDLAITPPFLGGVPASGNVQFTDARRIGVSPNPVGQFLGSAAAANVLANSPFQLAPRAGLFWEPLEETVLKMLVIPPGEGLGMADQTGNAVFEAVVAWTEEPLGVTRLLG